MAEKLYNEVKQICVEVVKIETQMYNHLRCIEHRLFKEPDTDIDLHVFSSGASRNDRMMRFWDWLRSNKKKREKYAQVKQSLAKIKWQHVQHYADAKT